MSRSPTAWSGPFADRSASSRRAGRRECGESARGRQPRAPALDARVRWPRPEGSVGAVPALAGVGAGDEPAAPEAACSWTTRLLRHRSGRGRPPCPGSRTARPGGAASKPAPRGGARETAEQARLIALRSQLDPHFLVNTLNAIAEWRRTDGEAAERAVLELVELLRAVLAGGRAPTWPLSQELALVRRLYALHLLRDGGLFTLEERVPDPLPDVPVPPLLLLTSRGELCEARAGGRSSRNHCPRGGAVGADAPNRPRKPRRVRGTAAGERGVSDPRAEAVARVRACGVGVDDAGRRAHAGGGDAAADK